METISNILLSISWLGTVILIIQENQSEITFWGTMTATVLTIAHRLWGLTKEYIELKKKKNDKEYN